MANEKLEYCRECGQPVAKKALRCPHCGAKHKRGHPVLYTLLGIFLFILIFGDSNNEPKKVGERSVEEQPTLTQEAPSKQTVFYKGDVVNLNGVLVTLTRVTESRGSEFNKPTAGNIFVLCEFEIENNSQKDANFSSLLSFEAYHDGYAANFSLGAILEKGSRNQLDGTVAPGKKFSGVVGYEFPDDWHELEIKITPDFWQGQDISFVYNRGY